MPIYDFQCSCGVRFEAAVSFAVKEEERPCPACGGKASRLMPATVSGVFNKELNGPAPPNTGLQSLDAHIDRVIGQSAAKGWATQEARKKDKLDVAADAGVATHELSQTPDQSWRPLAKEERAAQERAHKINNLATQTFKSRRSQGRG